MRFLAATETNALEATLYGVRGAPPSMAGQLMLEHKGIRYRRVDLPTGRHGKKLAKHGFAGNTVPALNLDGEPVQTNRAIARALEAAVPEPPLFPRDPAARRAVERAEAFCDERLQPATRRITLWTLRSDPDAVSFHPRLGPLMPPRLPGVVRKIGLRKAFEYYGVTSVVAAEDVRSLRGMLDQIDGWISEGVLNGAELNAADFQTGPLICLLVGLGDLGAQIAERPAGALGRRVLPDAPGERRPAL